MYKLIFEKRAIKQLNKLERNIKKRIWKKLQKCKKNPFRYLESLTDIDGYKLRVGDYRIIIDVEKEIKILNILKLGHRKKIYKK